jgi:hypothetical protein
MATTGIAQQRIDPQQEAEHLRQQMRQIRRELGEEVEELVENAERLMDWRYYVHRYPWFMVGVAAFIGYYLVPRRTVAFPTDNNTLARLAERIPVVVRQEPEAKKPGLYGSLLSFGTNLLMRAALAYAGQQLGKIMGQQATEPQPVGTPHG